MFRLTESVGDFSAGQRLRITASYGEWHLYDIKLEPPDDADDRSIELTKAKLESVAERVD